jgi:hypothetical protein
MKRTLWIACLVAIAILTGAAPAVRAHSCSMKNVSAIYAYTSSGTIVTPPDGPFVAVGKITFGPSGTITGEPTTSVAGNFFDETVTGTVIAVNAYRISDNEE